MGKREPQRATAPSGAVFFGVDARKEPDKPVPKTPPLLRHSNELRVTVYCYYVCLMASTITINGISRLWLPLMLPCRNKPRFKVTGGILSVYVWGNQFYFWFAAKKRQAPSLAILRQRPRGICLITYRS